MKGRKANGQLRKGYKLTKSGKVVKVSAANKRKVKKKVRKPKK